MMIDRTDGRAVVGSDGSAPSAPIVPRIAEAAVAYDHAPEGDQPERKWPRWLRLTCFLLFGAVAWLVILLLLR